MKRTGIKTILFLLAFVVQSHAEGKIDETRPKLEKEIYQFTNESEISYAVDVKILLAFQTTVSGKTSDIKGTINLNADKSPESTVKSPPVTGELFVDSGTFRSGIGKRDADIREILQSDKYPQIVFSITGLESVSPQKSGQLSGPMTVKGNLDFKGIKKEITFQVVSTPKGGKLYVDGKIPLKLTDFGINPPTLGIFIGRATDEITLSLHLVAESKKAGFLSIIS
jgi:polyisoprenoid-binding protein YceI